MKNLFITLITVGCIYCLPTKKIYTVEGMMCGYGCVNTINSVLKKLDGIHEFIVDFENKKMEIVFESKNLTNEEVIASLPNPYKAAFVKETISKEYAVEGMTCMGCVNTIENSIKKLEGLELYDIKFQEGMLFIEYDINITDSKTILNKIPSKFKVVELVSIDNNKVEDSKN